MDQTSGIAAAMPVNLNFITGSAPQPVGSSFHIHPEGALSNVLGPAINLDARTVSHENQGIRVRDLEIAHLTHPNTTATHWTDSLTNPSNTVVGLTPYLHNREGATMPAEEDVTLSSKTPFVDGFADTETLSKERVLADIDFGVPEQDSCGGDSWSSYGLGDGLLQQTGGTEINLAYFFNDHEWKDLEMDGFGGH